MIDITEKSVSLRTATARGFLRCDAAVLARVRAGSVPKGDVFGFARTAAMFAAKRTAELLPHCHPVPVEFLDVSFELYDSVPEDLDPPRAAVPAGIEVRVRAKSIHRTGIEMEVLTATSIALLTLYDLLKPLDGPLLITGIELLEKTGGKSGQRSVRGLRAALLVISDRSARGEREDRVGPALREFLEERGVRVSEYSIVPDEEQRILDYVKNWSAAGLDFIFTSGGTGLSPRDRTPEALRSLFDREVPGIAEAMRAYGRERTALAMLSRSQAGIVGTSLVLTLPGSPRGARESLLAVFAALVHARDIIHGVDHA